MVIGQLGIALLGSCAAFSWYTLKLRRANTELFEALEALRGAPPATDETTVATAEPEEDSTTAESEPDPALAAPEPSTPEPPAASIEANAENAEQAPSEPEGATNTGGMDSGLKVLLQQFTQDSRDMMARIDELESQTRALIAAAQQAPANEISASEEMDESKESEEATDNTEPASAAG